MIKGSLRKIIGFAFLDGLAIAVIIIIVVTLLTK